MSYRDAASSEWRTIREGVRKGNLCYHEFWFGDSAFLAEVADRLVKLWVFVFWKCSDLVDSVNHVWRDEPLDYVEGYDEDCKR